MKICHHQYTSDKEVSRTSPELSCSAFYQIIITPQSYPDIKELTLDKAIMNFMLTIAKLPLPYKDALDVLGIVSVASGSSSCRGSFISVTRPGPFEDMRPIMAPRLQIWHHPQQ